MGRFQQSIYTKESLQCSDVRAAAHQRSGQRSLRVACHGEECRYGLRHLPAPRAPHGQAPEIRIFAGRIGDGERHADAYLYITIKGVSESYSYSVPDAFSSFMIDQSLLPSLPFPAVHGYYLDQQIQLTALLLNYGFTSPRPLRRLGLRERRGTRLRLSHNLRTRKPQQNLRVPPRREQHDLCESRRRRREPGRHPGQPVHLPHHGHGRTPERRGRLPLG